MHWKTSHRLIVSTKQQLCYKLRTGKSRRIIWKFAGKQKNYQSTSHVTTALCYWQEKQQAISWCNTVASQIRTFQKEKGKKIHKGKKKTLFLLIQKSGTVLQYSALKLKELKNLIWFKWSHKTKLHFSLHAASSTDSSFARIPPILLKAGIWIPYFSSSSLILLISSSETHRRTGLTH